MKRRFLFNEEQRFANTMLFYLVLGTSSVVAAVMVTLLWIIGGSFESMALLMGPILILASMLFFFLRLKSYAFYHRFTPLVNVEKKLTKQGMIAYYLRKYRPFWEYEGWGYRIRPGKGNALRIAGNTDLQKLELSNRIGLLIGTQKPAAYLRIHHRVMDNWESIDG